MKRTVIPPGRSSTALPRRRLGAGNWLPAHEGRVSALAFTPDSAGVWIIASGGADAAVRAWDPVTGCQTGDRLNHIAWVDALAWGFGVNGRPMLVSVGGGTARAWDPLSSRLLARPLSERKVNISGAVAFGQGITMSPVFALVASWQDDYFIILWDALNNREVGELPRHDGAINGLAFGNRADGSLLLTSAGDDCLVRLWDPTAIRELGQLHGHDGWVNAVALSERWNDGWLLCSGGVDGSVRLWDVVRGVPVASPMMGHEGSVEAVSFCRRPRESPLVISGGSDGTARVWDPTTGALLRTLVGHDGAVHAVACSLHDGAPLVATGGEDGAILLWDPLTGATR